MTLIIVISLLNDSKKYIIIVFVILNQSSFK